MATRKKIFGKCNSKYNISHYTQYAHYTKKRQTIKNVAKNMNKFESSHIAKQKHKIRKPLQKTICQLLKMINIVTI